MLVKTAGLNRDLIFTNIDLSVYQNNLMWGIAPNINHWFLWPGIDYLQVAMIRWKTAILNNIHMSNYVCLQQAKIDAVTEYQTKLAEQKEREVAAKKKIEELAKKKEEEAKAKEEENNDGEVKDEKMDTDGETPATEENQEETDQVKSETEQMETVQDTEATEEEQLKGDEEAVPLEEGDEEKLLSKDPTGDEAEGEGEVEEWVGEAEAEAEVEEEAQTPTRRGRRGARGRGRGRGKK